jgi:mono/diheme cytochrome c family protein
MRGLAVAPTFKPFALSAVAAIAALATSALAAPPPATPTPAEGAAMAERGNGTMGMFTGAGGDPVAGEKLYQQKCASCHDAPSGRIPPKAAITANTPTMIMSTLLEGVMAPMARGLAPKDMAAIAAYLSTRKDGGLGAGALEAPACADKPGPLDLNAPSQWNGWGRTETQARYQPKPGIAAARRA